MERSNKLHLPATWADTRGAVLLSHFDLFLLHKEQIILASCNTFDAEVCSTFCATLQLNPVIAELQMSNFSLLWFHLFKFFSSLKSCTFMLPPHHKHVYDKFIIAAPNRHVGVCHMEAEEAVIGIPTSVCQPVPLSSRQSESWQRMRQAFPIPHPSLFFLFAACDEKKARSVCVCMCGVLD